MRVLVTFIGGLGHFQPMVPVARAMAAGGHEVSVACSGGLVDQVAAAGFAALPTSAVRARPPTVRDLTPLEPVDPRAAELEFATNFADKGARRHALAVREHLLSWRPDLVIRDEADFGSQIAAEVLGVPTATVLVLASGMLIRPELVATPWAALRAEHGLAPDPDLSMLTRGLVLSPFPRSIRSPDSPLSLPGTTQYFRAGRSELTSAPGQATKQIYATLGTVFNTGSGDLFERLLVGLAQVDADVLVTVGRDLDPSVFGPRPERVSVQRFVPEAEAMRDRDLVVSHAGSGSLLSALAHGVCSVLLPLGADQPHNAQRAEALGVARVLDAATATPETIRRCVEQTLDDEPMRERAHVIAEEIAALAPVEDVVPTLEAHAAGADRRTP